MSVHFILFAPLALLLPPAGSVDPTPEIMEQAIAPSGDADEGEGPRWALRYGEAVSTIPSDRGFADERPFSVVAEAFRAEEANQVRIERRITIRITPRPSPTRRNMLMDLPGRAASPRFVERKMGKCVDISDIAGVQPDGGNRLLLFMRDQRIVGAELERACRSRDFYSGFYLSRSSDGRLCVDRDMLLSRSGANCTLTSMSRLVEVDD